MHVAVVGGGVTGLSVAWALRRSDPSVQVSVLEAARDVGGRLTVGDLGGHAVDAGAESCDDVPALTDLLADVGLDDRVVHPTSTSTRVLLPDGLRRVPAGTVAGVPGDLVALARSGVLTRSGLVRAGLDAALPVKPEHSDVAVGRWVTSRLGAEVTRRLVAPLLGVVHPGDVDRLSIAAVLPALAAARAQGRRATPAARELHRGPGLGVDGRPRPLSLRDGLGRLPAALAAASGAHVRTGTTVRVVTRTAPGRWRLELGPVPHPQVLDVDAVVLALPPLAAARLLRPLVPAAATLLDTVATASVATVTLAYRRKDVAAGSLVGSGHVVPVEAGTPVRAVSYASQRWTWLARALPDLELLRVSVGRVGDEQVLQREDADLVTLAARHLVDTLGVAAKPAAGAVFRWGGALPLYAVGHVSRVERVRSVVASQPGLVLAGTGLDGTGVHACVAAAQRAAEQVLASAAQPQRLP